MLFPPPLWSACSSFLLAAALSQKESWRIKTERRAFAKQRLLSLSWCIPSSLCVARSFLRPQYLTSLKTERTFATNQVHDSGPPVPARTGRNVGVFSVFIFKLRKSPVRTIEHLVAKAESKSSETFHKLLLSRTQRDLQQLHLT